MSNHNYSQYSKMNAPANEPKTEETVEVANETAIQDGVVIEVPAEVAEVKMEPEKTIESLPNTITGVVTNCAKLNVRAEPSITANPVCVLDAAAELEVIMSESTDEWFKVCTATGIEGYCMRKFITADL